MEKTSFRLPFEGRIRKSNLVVGQFVKVGQVLFEADGTSRVELHSQISPKNMKVLLGGKEHQVRWSGTNMGNLVARLQWESEMKFVGTKFPYRWKANLNRIDGVVDPTTRTLGIVFTVEEPWENLIIVSRANGFELKLGDFAQIEYDFEFEEDQVEFHSQRAAILNLMMNPTDDVLNLTEQIKDFISEQSQKYNQKVDFHFTKDNAGIVKDRLNMLVSNAIQGLLLVSVVLYLFFGLKFSFWVVLGLPVSFAGAFYLMTPLGQSINMMSMVGLLLAIGILMDDAVVISENIASHFQKGKSPVQAAIDGTKEVFASVLSSFLTTVAMFSGLIFISGDIGRILKAIPIVLILVLAVSLLEAFLILPHHVKESLGHFAGESGIRHRFLNWFERLRLNQFEPLIRACLKNRYLTVSLMVILLFVSVSMITGRKLKFSAIPDLEGNTIVSRVAMPPGTPLQKTKEVCNTILMKFQELDQEYREKYKDSLIRGIYTRYSHNVDYQESGPHVATVTVDLISPQERKMSLVQILSRWEELVGQIAGASSISYQEPVLGPSGRPLHLRLFHHDLEVLSISSQSLKQKMSGYKGVHNVMTDLRPGQPQVKIALQSGIMATGLSNQNLGEQLSSAIQGRKIQDVTLNSDVTEIVVTASRENQGRLDFVDHFNLKLQDEKRISMEQAGTIETSRDWSRISRSNGKRMINVTAEIDSEFANAAEIIQNLKAEFLPTLQAKNPGLKIAVEGEVKNARQTGSSIQSAFLSGLVGLFLILSYQFGCYLQPLLILMTIPLSLIGVIWGHLILGFDLSLPSLMGFVALTGVMVNNAIMLVHFVELHKEDGMELSQSAIQASLARFRPIIITTSTTLVSMLPLLFERSLQAQILQPLVISLCFGLASATVLVLIFLPCLYGIMEDMRQ